MEVGFRAVERERDGKMTGQKLEPGPEDGNCDAAWI